LHPEYFKSEVTLKKDKKIEVMCDQCACVMDVPIIEGLKGEIVVECEWCSNKYLVNLDEK